MTSPMTAGCRYPDCNSEAPVIMRRRGKGRALALGTPSVVVRLSVLAAIAAAGGGAPTTLARSPASLRVETPGKLGRPPTTPPCGQASPRVETPGKFGRLSVRWEDRRPAAPPAPGSRPERHAALFRRLEEAFGQRPVWSTLALRNTLGVSREALRETLPFIGYKFRDGPWKGLWTRFGYDPRASPEARDLQVRARGACARRPRARRTEPLPCFFSRARARVGVFNHARAKRLGGGPRDAALHARAQERPHAVGRALAPLHPGAGALRIDSFNSVSCIE
jgi:hypothetical protein